MFGKNKQMVILVLRHGFKQYDNKAKNQSYRFDSPLDMTKTVDMIKIHSLPCFQAIYTSPYLRARQTAQMICDLSPAPIYVDNDIVEYLGNHAVIEPCDFYPDTWNQQPKFLSPYSNYVSHCTKYKLREDCCYVGHSGFVKALAETHALRLDHIEEYSGFLIENGVATKWKF